MGFKRRHGDHGGGRDALGMIAQCHERLDERMARLVEACGAVARGEATDADRDAAIEVADYLARSIPRHVADEEESLFPRLAAAAPALAPLTDSLAREHRGHEALHAALLAQAQPWLDGGPTPDAAVGAEIERLADALRTAYRDHTEREDRDLVPAVARHLDADALVASLDEMQARRGR